MAHDAHHLERLVRELAELAPEEREHVVSEVERLQAVESTKARFVVPKLKGGTAWIGGDLRREDLYGDEGR
ncbi:MAG: hypothetical protein R3B70_35025 [Polyangiaceae bacterium]